MATQAPVTPAAPAPVAAPAPAAPASPAPSTPATPAAPATPQTASTPAAAPVPAEQPQAPATPAAAPADGPWQSKLDRANFKDSDSYAAALLKERLEALNAAEPPPAPVEPAKPAEQQAPPAEAAKPAEQQQPPAPAEPFSPESLNQLIDGNAQLKALVDADPALKNQLFHTSRVAAEGAAFKKVFPDVKAAEFAKGNSQTYVNVRETFLGSATPDGAKKAVEAISQLCYERDGQGNVVMENGVPVIGDDFYGFVNHIEKSGLEMRINQAKQRLNANRYANEDERDADESMLAAAERLMEDFAPSSKATGHGEEVPEELRARFAEVERREQALNQAENERKAGERNNFEKDLIGEANNRIRGGIAAQVAAVKEQGGQIAPYLEGVLIAKIGEKLARACEADPTLRDTMRELKHLPVGTDARTRRLEVVDRAIQQLLPEIAQAEFKEAGIQWAQTQAAKETKINAQTTQTKREEIQGSTTPANPNAQGPLSVEQAWAQATAYWEKKHPGRSANDPGVRNEIIPLAMNLRLGQKLPE